MRQTQIVAAAIVHFFVIGAVGAVAVGPEAQSEIVYGDAHGSVVITAPQGWVFDHDNRADQDLRAVLYPAGISPAKALSVIYVKTVSKDGRPNLGSLIAGDVERRRASSPGLTVALGDPLPTARDSEAQVERFSGATVLESVAYLETPTVYVTIILSSKTDAAQKEGLRAFADLVKSYHVSTVTAGAVKK